MLHVHRVLSGASWSCFCSDCRIPPGVKHPAATAMGSAAPPPPADAAAAVSAVSPPSGFASKLLAAVSAGDAREVAAILSATAAANSGESPGSLLNAARGEDGMTPLMRASFRGEVEVVRVLLSAGADVHTRGTGYSHHSTALHEAAARGEPAIVELLVDAGASVNECDGHGTTPLMLAARWHHAPALEALLAAGANIAAQDNAGRGAIMHAVAGHAGNAVRLLAARGADADANDRAGLSAAALAAFDPSMRRAIAAGQHIWNCWLRRRDLVALRQHLLA